MPRIRKKTSNRASTNDRAKVRHKVKETKKKKAKTAKKNPQWKSRKPKDPGIPNEFPYKDQILAEVVEQRRIAVEEKERQKAEKQHALKKARAVARGEAVDSEEGEGDEEDGKEVGEEEEEEEESNGKLKKKDLNVGADSIASLSAKIVKAELKPRPRSISERKKDAEEEEEEEVPILINRDLPTLRSVLEKADVVLEVVDARDPLAFRSEHVEQLVKDAEKKILLVLNKIDTCPREALAAWAGYLRMQCPTLMFRSATAFLPEGSTMQDPLAKKVKGKGKAKIQTDDALGTESVLNCLFQWAKEKKGEEALTVAVVGVTNVGKSSLINSLLKRAALPIYTLTSSSRGPSTTETPQTVTLEVESQKIVLIDTPGLSFISDEDADQSNLEEFRSRDILLRSKGRIDRLKDPHPPVAHIVSRSNTEDLMLLYSLPAFVKGDSTAFLSGLARASQLVKKKGELDLAGAARLVLRDWSLGKFTRYTTPPTPPTPIVNATAAQPSITAKPGDGIIQLYVNDEAILSAIQTKKERRKQCGLVKFTYGSIDPRKAAVEELWNGLERNDDGESDIEVDGPDVDDENDEDEEEEKEEEEEEASDAEMEGSQEREKDAEDADTNDDEDESEIELPRLSREQKRKRGPEISMPSKKVVFAAMPPARESKSNRRKIEAMTPSKKELMNKAQQKNAMKGLRKPSPRATTTAFPVHKTSEKVANASIKTKAKGRLALGGKSKDKSEPEMYDFGKFF